jgi:hypothetical protein
MKSDKGKVNQKRKGNEINFKKIIIQLLILLIIIIASYLFVSKFMKKERVKVIPKKELFTSYPFITTNPRHDLVKQIKIWFSKKTVIKKNPIDWPGEQGKGVVIPANMKQIADKRFKENQFNIVASEIIALDRTIPDGREKELIF